jgi:hypothetical protein
MRFISFADSSFCLHKQKPKRVCGNRCDVLLSGITKELAFMRPKVSVNPRLSILVLRKAIKALCEHQQQNAPFKSKTRHFLIRCHSGRCFQHKKFIAVGCAFVSARKTI